MKYPRYLPLCILLLLSLSFFIPAIMQGKLFLPADTIVGLYHPYRDSMAKVYPNGTPYKNFLVTDPVRQQFPWKTLTVASEKKAHIPLWNPYTFAGTPLLANFQTGAFYPLTLLFFVLPFITGWNLLIMLQPILAAVFMYLYLKRIKLHSVAAGMGGFIFAFCGFSVAWLEWGTIIHTALWLPLILLAIDEIATSSVQRAASHKDIKNTILWPIILIISLSSSFFAGHLQTFFYIMVTACMYALVRWVQHGKSKKTITLYALCSMLFAIITFVQWYPTLQFILLSARGVDQLDWQKAGWFIPWQNSIQFIAPDFFGNPATLNYFGVWNYAEFVGYIGIAPLLFVLYALLSRRDKKTFFFGGLLLIACLFAFPTILAALPFSLSLPFIASSQPTRLVFLIDFALAVLAALGLDYFLKQSKRLSILIPIAILSICIGALWISLEFFSETLGFPPESIAVAKRNIQLPTVLIVVSAFVILLMIFVRNKKLQTVLLAMILLLVVFDLFRFSTKFTPFTQKEYLYPSTKALTFLIEKSDNYRYMSLDSRILPPNFSLMYGLQTIEGYDPLYLLRYGELIAASERKEPDSTPPFGFNRIITPREVDSPIIDLLGVKYILSLSDIAYPHIKKVFQEGETRVYENTRVLPRAFFVTDTTVLGDNQKQQALQFLFDKQNNLRNVAVVEGPLTQNNYASGSAKIIEYTPERVVIQTETTGVGFLVVTDSFYPTWKASIKAENISQAQEVPILRTDYQFRGVVVPEGTHTVEFINTL